MIIDGIDITADFDADKDELARYVACVREHVREPVDTIRVHLCDDGCVDVNWLSHGQKFERIRRITGAD